MFEGDIVRDLDPSLSPTEWRRAAASAAACVAVDPEMAVERCQSILTGRVFQKDPGVAGAMVLGLSRAVDMEPEAANELIEQLVGTGGLDAIEALVQLRQEHANPSVGAGAVSVALERLESQAFSSGGDDGRAALIRALTRELGAGDASLMVHTKAAVEAFVVEGAVAAHGKAKLALDRVDGLLTALVATPGRFETFDLLRELDQGWLERSTLSDLLSLGARPESSLGRLDGQLDRLADWLVVSEGESDSEKEAHFTYQLHKLRAMLHLVDGDPIETSGTLGVGQRSRKLRAARWLLDRVSDNPPLPLRRVLAASAARACDALLREEVGELSDILILVGDRIDDPVDLSTMAEASMDPSMEAALRGYGRYLGGCPRGPGVQILSLEGLEELVVGLPVLGSPRVEALRNAIQAYSGSVWALQSVLCLTQVAGAESGEAPRIPPLADACGWLARLAVGARGRMDEAKGSKLSCGGALHRVDAGVEQALRGDPEPLRRALGEALEVMGRELPLGLEHAVGGALKGLVSLPLELPEAPFVLTRARPQDALVLPSWMPASRVLGGFHVLSLLSCGGVGSVFVVCRVEDRGKRHPRKFAMKVPEYGPDVAHTLSEKEFLDLFRDEAGALLTIPEHPNLARLVTFDAGVRPKPILVMELVEGPTLQRLIGTRVLGMERALGILDGVAAGLEAMHGIGVGHLDVKPGNVILRATEGRAPVELDLGQVPRASRFPVGVEEGPPVLVDFGLSGRKIRPGCATASYGAPEIWGYGPEGALPMAADVYGFACTVFETLTGEELFRGEHHLAVIASHVSHDGDPPGLERVAGYPRLGELLRAGLRRDPGARCTISEFRWGLGGLGLGERWPV
jgi:hypothetical protein